MIELIKSRPGLASAPNANLRVKAAALLELARPSHVVKNGVVVVPWLLAGFEGSALAVVATLLGFVLASVAVYAINDSMDAAVDAAHPKKRHRPIPSGRVSVPEALAFALLAATAAGSATAILATDALAFVAVYLALNLFYSKVGKDIAVVDVAIVGAGFALRFLAGLAAIGMLGELAWAAGPIFIASVGLAVGKRLAKKATSAEKTDARVPRFYTPNVLTGLLILLSHLAVLAGAWAAFSADADIAGRFSLAPPVIAILSLIGVGVLSRAVYLMTTDSVEPATVFTRDRPTLVAVALGASILGFNALV
ncbi:UbiA family prenyltransferase [Salinarimonas ramus]|uniref:Decaprenyl-phosphate phosphoribosyltransferase n=1 Tax=Salinarimonas ramus TaxID=690164 RepID=A0A917QB84_9HYPH|nr:UbiA family prenyltransferase [Salinarimonas ramus]GGK40493.1 decaprenyl-phosphate phosphoribosyltransferase [Salinarimonas ramus]